MEVFFVFLQLGCTSFGGPTAHIGYFQKEFVERRKWLSAETFAELVALSQSLPGPASSQVGFAVGVLRSGLLGGVAAWIGFTLPSALLMLAFAFGHEVLKGNGGTALLHGLQLVAVAVVAQAVLAMQRRLAPDILRAFIAVAASGLVFFAPTPVATLFAILWGSVAGIFLLRRERTSPQIVAFSVVPVSRQISIWAISIFAALLCGTLLLRANELTASTLFAGFYRTGALVFGGGHVVLPLLDSSTVAKGWIPENIFLSGYGAAQALPGPLFSFAAYVGATVQPNPKPILFGSLALVAIFLPGLLLMTAVLPFWDRIRQIRSISNALDGVNASVVGILFAALVRPVWTSTVHSIPDFFIVLSAFIALTLTKIRPWIVVLTVGTLCWLWAVL